jgi:amino acid transporter
MNPLVEYNLSLILFLPWFLILGTLFWCYPRQPRHTRRHVFDTLSLVFALLAFLASIYWSFDNADTRYGKMWPQVLATALGYGVFLGVMTIAFFLRRTWLRHTQPLSKDSSV